MSSGAGDKHLTWLSPCIWHLCLGIAILAAAMAGLLIVAINGITKSCVSEGLVVALHSLIKTWFAFQCEHQAINLIITRHPDAWDGDGSGMIANHHHQ